MASILIADRYKSSLVMTSEVFKDKLPGTNVTIAKNGIDCLEQVKQGAFDMIVVDFDLPDTDGVSLTKALRALYTGPIIITAFPEKIVDEAICKELFGYSDSSRWVKKPVKFEEMCDPIEEFLIKKNRLRTRYKSRMDGTLVGKGAGRGKRAPKSLGVVENLSIGGALFSSTDKPTMSKGDEIVLALQSKPTKSKAKTKAKAPQKELQKIKAQIKWINKVKKQVGLEFTNINDSSRTYLESIMRKSKEL